MYNRIMLNPMHCHTIFNLTSFCREIKESTASCNESGSSTSKVKSTHESKMSANNRAGTEPFHGAICSLVPVSDRLAVSGQGGRGVFVYAGDELIADSRGC